MPSDRCPIIETLELLLSQAIATYICERAHPYLAQISPTARLGLQWHGHETLRAMVVVVRYTRDRVIHDGLLHMHNGPSIPSQISAMVQTWRT